MTCVAHIDAQNAKKLAIDTTAVVVPDHLTMDPMHNDRMNCAKNTILLTIAMSVPSPRICARSSGVLVASRANCERAWKRIQTLNDYLRSRNLKACDSLKYVRYPPNDSVPQVNRAW